MTKNNGDQFRNMRNCMRFQTKEMCALSHNTHATIQLCLAPNQEW